MRISSASSPNGRRRVYLIDANVISEARKKAKANPGVVEFFNHVASTGEAVCLAVVTVGELRRGIELIRLCGDAEQATLLEDWLKIVLDQYAYNVLVFDADAAQIWGRLRVPNPEHALDKQIAAAALVHESSFSESVTRYCNCRRKVSVAMWFRVGYRQYRLS